MDPAGGDAPSSCCLQTEVMNMKIARMPTSVTGLTLTELFDDEMALLPFNCGQHHLIILQSFKPDRAAHHILYMMAVHT
jgi:hypothetical protein